jgi:hypothetical protein
MRYSLLVVVLVAVAAYLIGSKFPATGEAVLGKVGLAA